jgi:outer membrane lipoprotein SlyB
MRRAPLVVLASTLLIGCATRPIVYPTEELRRSGAGAVREDTTACLAEAEAYVEDGRVPEAAKRTAGGAVVGGAVGGAVGAVRGSVGRGAAAGAAGGAAGTLAHTLWNWRDPDPVVKRYVERCLAERGYDVIGWR